jgi:hypothetical protein
MKERGYSSFNDEDESLSGADIAWLQAADYNEWSPEFQSRLDQLEQETQALSDALQELLARSRGSQNND